MRKGIAIVAWPLFILAWCSLGLELVAVVSIGEKTCRFCRCNDEQQSCHGVACVFVREADVE